jgi:hypothetical protein
VLRRSRPIRNSSFIIRNWSGAAAPLTLEEFFQHGAQEREKGRNNVFHYSPPPALILQ